MKKALIVVGIVALAVVAFNAVTLFGYMILERVSQ